MTSRIHFLKEALRTIKTSGTVIPSSRFLANRMLKDICFSKLKVLVELGPGNGVITRCILEKLHPNTILVCFEINNNFYQQLQEINHPQLILIKASAEKIEEELNRLGFSKVDCIISSLPLSIIPNNISKKILHKSFTTLKAGGFFIQYQYSLTYFRKLKKIFNQSISLEFEPLNFPPAFVFFCKKTH